MAGVVLGQRRSGAACRAAGRDLRRRAGAHQRVRDRGRPSRAREGSAMARLAGHGHAADADPRAFAPRSARTPTRCWPNGSHATQKSRDRPPHRSTRSRESRCVDARRVPRRAARPDVAQRPRRRRGEGRAAGRRGHALGRVVVLRLPARQARRRARPQVARRARRARRAARAGRHPPPQPAHARGAPARPRRGDACAR